MSMASSETQERSRRSSVKGDGADRRETTDEYLERIGLAPLLREGLSAVLQARPEDPIQFLHDYYVDLMRGGNALSKAIRLLRRTRPDAGQFGDVIFQAYNILSTKKSASVTQNGATGQPSGPARALVGEEYAKFVRAVLSEVPPECADQLLARIHIPRDGDVVEFCAFRNGVAWSCVVADIIADVLAFVREVGPDESGRISREVVTDALPFIVERHRASVAIHRLPLDELSARMDEGVPRLVNAVDVFRLTCLALWKEGQ